MVTGDQDKWWREPTSSYIGSYLDNTFIIGQCNRTKVKINRERTGKVIGWWFSESKKVRKSSQFFLSTITALQTLTWMWKGRARGSPWAKCPPGHPPRTGGVGGAGSRSRAGYHWQGRRQSGHRTLERFNHQNNKMTISLQKLQIKI